MKEYLIYTGYSEVSARIYLSLLDYRFEDEFAIFPSNLTKLDVGTMSILRGQLQHQPD